MRTQILSIGLFTALSMASFTIYAEPPVQAGETIESLSKAKVSTTVNGQPGSLQDLVTSGQVKLLNDQPLQPATQISNEHAPVAIGKIQIQNHPIAAQPEVDSELPQLADPAP